MDQKLAGNLQAGTWYKTRGGRRALVTLVKSNKTLGRVLESDVAEGLIYYDDAIEDSLGDVAFWWAHETRAGLQYLGAEMLEDLVAFWPIKGQLDLFLVAQV